MDACFDVEAASDNPAARHVFRKTELKEFTDDVSLNLRKSVIDCLTDHNIDDCPGKKTGQLPRRVLDVGPVLPDDTIDEDGPVKLKESREGETAIYTTLSYCWGDGQHQLTTKKSTLHARLQGLPNNRELPKTIADAIRVTRHLGIQYLWVDALCIIQDDETDKLEQIDAMSEIFRNSTITIAASSASSVSEGFLATAKPLKTVAKVPLLLAAGNDSAEKGEIYLRGDWVRVSVDDEPLYSRAWAFQETILSPRVLDFTTYNSVHMCSDQDYPSLFSGYRLSGYEWSGSQIFKHIHRLESSKWFQSLYFMHPRYLFRPGEFDRETFGMWRDVVYQYSRRRLSLPTDRLPALSGIAKRLSPFAGDYVAGLWKESIVYHLGWEHENMQNWPQGKPTKGSGVEHTSRAIETSRPSPSWSWVSVPYGVFVAPLLTVDASLVDCQIAPVSDLNPHGQVKKGILTLRAKIIEYSDLPIAPRFVRDGADAVVENNEVSIRLDYGEPAPPIIDRNPVRLVYLGARSHYDGDYGTTLGPSADAQTFLVVNKEADEPNYRRIGIFHLQESDVLIQSGKLNALFDSISAQTISIE